MGDRLAALHRAGVSIWLDDLSRDRIDSGGLTELVSHQHVTGITTNPSIFAKAMTGSAAYAEQLTRLAAQGADAPSALTALTTLDVRRACDVLRPVFERTDGIDGRVSIEVDPRHAYDTESTISEARTLWHEVNRRNLFVKIPAAHQGLAAITTCLAEGISINVTLLFSLARYGQVQEAFLDGLEQAEEAGHDLSGIHSVASFFVSRVDTAVDTRLDRIGSGLARSLRGRVGVANARLAYQQYEHMLASERWQALARVGARPQRVLWASTSTKDPTYPDTKYVTSLVAPDVVNTMPQATMVAFADHGEIPRTPIQDHYDEAHQVLARLDYLGISYEDVVATLEEEGITAFEEAWAELGDSIEEQLSRLKVRPHAGSPSRR